MENKESKSSDYFRQEEKLDRSKDLFLYLQSRFSEQFTRFDPYIRAYKEVSN